MMRTVTAMLALLALTATAHADKPRAGVDADSLTPAGLTRIKVRAPLEAGLPVRLVYSASERPEVLLDVVVAADAAGADVALEHWLHQASRKFPASRVAIGDATYATENAIVFTRHNVMVAVRRVAGTADVEAIARHALAAVERAPVRRRAGLAVRAAVPRLEVGKSTPLALTGTALAAQVRATGPAHVRRTRAGWRLARSGTGDIAVEVIAVDDLLRVTVHTTGE